MRSTSGSWSRSRRDASLSNQALAAQVHVSPATCLRRVKRLVDAGIVERRVAILSPQRLGHGLTAIVEVTLDRQSAEALAAFEARAVAEDAVRQCHRVSPGPDFILTIQLADMAAYHALVQRLFTADANVRNIKAFFSVHRAKFETRIALPAADLSAPSGARLERDQLAALDAEDGAVLQDGADLVLHLALGGGREPDDPLVPGAGAVGLVGGEALGGRCAGCRTCRPASRCSPRPRRCTSGRT